MNDTCHLHAAMTCCERLARLPCVPTHDWCDQAAAAFGGIAPNGMTAVLVASLDDSGRVLAEAIGGVWASPAAAARFEGCADRLRCGLERLEGQAWCPGERTLTGPSCALALDLSSMPGPFADMWDASSPKPVIAAGTPFGSSGCSILVYVAPLEAGVGPDRVEQVHGLLGPLARAAARALRHGRLRSGDWVSPREQQVLTELVVGRTVREIASGLGRSPHTVHDHVKSLHRKLHASTRGELVARALGYIEDLASA